MGKDTRVDVEDFKHLPIEMQGFFSNVKLFFMSFFIVGAKLNYLTCASNNILHVDFNKLMSIGKAKTNKINRIYENRKIKGLWFIFSDGTISHKFLQTYKMDDVFENVVYDSNDFLRRKERTGKNDLKIVGLKIAYKDENKKETISSCKLREITYDDMLKYLKK